MSRRLRPRQNYSSTQKAKARRLTAPPPRGVAVDQRPPRPGHHAVVDEPSAEERGGQADAAGQHAGSARTAASTGTPSAVTPNEITDGSSFRNPATVWYRPNTLILQHVPTDPDWSEALTSDDQRGRTRKLCRGNDRFTTARHAQRYRPATGGATRSSGTGFPDVLTWAAAADGSGPANDRFRNGGTRTSPVLLRSRGRSRLGHRIWLLVAARGLAGC
jgi:hypothetical protein